MSRPSPFTELPINDLRDYVSTRVSRATIENWIRTGVTDANRKPMKLRARRVVCADGRCRYFATPADLKDFLECRPRLFCNFKYRYRDPR